MFYTDEWVIGLITEIQDMFPEGRTIDKGLIHCKVFFYGGL